MKKLFTFIGLGVGVAYLVKRVFRNPHQKRTDEHFAEQRTLANLNVAVAKGMERGRWHATYAEQEDLPNPYGRHMPEAPFYAGKVPFTSSRLPA